MNISSLLRRAGIRAIGSSHSSANRGSTIARKRSAAVRRAAWQSAETLESRTLFSAVAGVNATPSSGSSINLSWTLNDSSAAVEVDRSTDGSNFSAVATLHGQSSFSDTGLSAGTQYWYEVGDSTTVATAYTDAAVDSLTATAGAGYSSVAGRYVFYNNSSFDGNDTAINASDDSAIATDKSALLPGHTATFSNYITYNKGINGIMIDMAGLPSGATLSASDFTFKVGNSNTLSTWTSAAAPSAIGIRTGAGASGSDRVEITWAANAVPNAKWLQVQVLPDANTGLASADVFYFGDAIADTSGFVGTHVNVNSTDQINIRNNNTASALVTNIYDINRNGVVDSTDEALPVSYPETFLNGLLDMITPGQAPSNNVATAEIGLSWNSNVTDATAIQIDRSVDGGVTFATLSTPTLAPSAASYNDTGLSDNTDYVYRVRLIRPGGDSAFTDPAEAVTLGAVSGLTATAASTTQINLGWTLNVSDDTGGLEVFRSINGGGFSADAMLGVGAVSYSETGLTEGNHYAYEVRADIAGVKNYTFSDPADAWTPSVVDSLAVNAVSTGEIDLSWNSNVTDATSMEVARSTDGTNYSVLPATLGGLTLSYHDTNLLANTDYWYRVRAIEPAGASSYTASADAFTYPLVENVMGAAAATDKVNLQWMLDVTDASSVEVDRSADGTSFSSIATLAGSSNSYSDTTVTEGNHYWYKLRATDAAGQSGFSAPTDVSTLPLQTLIATPASVSEIDLSWANISSNATAIEIDRSANGQDFTLLTNSLAGTATSYHDTSLTEDSHYWYRVRAIEPAGPSGFSTPTDTSTLAAVDALSATAVSATEVDLSWNVNATNSTAIEVDRSTDGSNFTALTSSLAGNAISFNDTTRSENTEYYYKVRAIQPGGASSFTDAANATTLPAVSGLTGSAVSTSEVQLSWTLNIADGTAIEVDRSSDGVNFSAVTTTLSGTAQTFNDTGLTEANQYSYQVRVIGAWGSSAFSDPAAASTAPIQNLAVGLGSTIEVLSWSNLSSTASAVEVDRSTDGVTFTSLTNTLPANATSYTATGLTADTENWYEVRAIETAGPAAFTNPLDTYTLPAAPTAFTATAVSTSEVDLTWTNNAGSSTPFFIKRREIGVEDNYTVIATTDPGATTYADTSVVDGETYAYSVAAVSQDGTDSNAFSGIVDATAPLDAPTALTVVANGANEIDLAWVNVSQGASGYTIEASTDGESFWQAGTIGSADQTSYTDSSVQAGTTYYYRVSATNGESSPPSDVASATTAPGVSISDGGAVAQGTPYTLNTSVLYAAGTADPVSGWTINWGDGTTDTPTGDPGSFTHTYTNPGSYTVKAATADGSFSGSAVAVVNYELGTLAVSGDFQGSSSTYSLTATLSHPTNHPVTSWYVDWGDGSQSTVTSGATDTTTLTHDYPHAGLQYTMSVSAVSDQGVVQATQPVSDSGGFGGSEVAWASGTLWFDDFDIARSGDTTYTITWGDGTSNSTITLAWNQGGIAAHDYAATLRAGNYPITITGSDGYAESTNAVITEPVPTITAPATQVVARGASLDITANYSGLLPSATAVAFIDWGDGTGLHPATISGGASGTISAHLDSAPAPGIHGARIYLYDAAIVAYDYGFPAPAAKADFAVNPYDIAFTIAGDLSRAQRALDENALGAPAIVDNNDLNANGIPDYADWADGPSFPAGTHFVQASLKIPAFAELSTTTVEFDYGGSNPASGSAPTAPLRLWLKDATVSRTSSDYIQPGTQYIASALPFASPAGGYRCLTIFVETVAPITTPNVTVMANVTVAPASSQPATVSDVVYVAPHGADMNIIHTDGSGNALEWDAKNTTGGYVVLNDNNDNGKFTNTPAPRPPGLTGASGKVPLASVTPVPDNSSTGVIPGEHDLTEITIETKDAEAAFKLVFGQQDLRVWMNADRSPARNLAANGANILIPQVISDKTVFYVSGEILRLYVEGVGMNNPVDRISLMCSFAKNGAPAVWETADQIAFHVFQVKGAEYVPGLSTYGYSASSDGLWSYDTGTGVFSQPVEADNAAGTQDVTFGAGPAIGGVRFSPAPGFLATRRVYVVNVTVDPGKIVLSRGPADARTPGGVGEGKYEVTTHDAFAPAPKDSIAFENRVSLQGPIDPNLHTQRGIPYMQVGYAQTVTMTSFNATYTNGPTIHSPMQGHTYTDGGIDKMGRQTTVYPWYDSAGQNGLSVFSGPDPGAQRTAVPMVIRTKDSPSVSLFQIYHLHTLLSAVVKWDFTMNIVARTLDSGQGNGSPYWQKARIAWFTDFSGASVRSNPPYEPAPSDPASGGSAVWTAGNAVVFSTGPGIDGSAFNPPVAPLGSVLMKNNADIANWVSG